MKRVGIFGGTFSPPHIGHISAAKAFLNEIKLDTLLVIPTFIPPHKEMHKIDPSHRLNMTRLAFSGEEGFNGSVTVSDYELKKQGVSYTFQTLEHFSAPDTRLFFLCGTDMFLTLDEWKNPARIFELSTIVLALREDITPQTSGKIARAKKYFEEKYSAEIIILENSPIEISSSELRDALALGKDTHKYLTPDVYDYIKENKLYLN